MYLVRNQCFVLGSNNMDKFRNEKKIYLHIIMYTIKIKILKKTHPYVYDQRLKFV